MSDKIAIQKVNRVCKSILKITDEDLLHVGDMAIKQVSYIHPLKQAKQSRLYKMGMNNLAIIDGIKHLQELIKKNKPE